MTFAQQSLDQIARSWIAKKYTSKTTQKRALPDLQLIANRKGLAGHTLRYQPLLNGIPVYNAEITIHISNSNTVTYALDELPKYSEVSSSNLKTITTDQALALAKAHLRVEGPITQETSKLYAYPLEGQTILAYVVHIKANTPVGYWEVVIDASTNAILSAKDISICRKNHKTIQPKKHKHNRRSHIGHSHTSHQSSKIKAQSKNANAMMSQSVNGTGLVFNPDPLSVNRVSYGGVYVDNNDADSPALNAARTSVVLRDIDFTDGIYTLKGPYVEIRDIEVPNKGLFQQASPNFNFTRSQDGFEAVNCYYHLDTSMRYINETLGISLVSLFNNGVLLFDPSGWDGDDQSSYINGMLSFGEGNVDDAEDADVIVHELGHGLHDWLTNGSLSQIEGLSEGCSDYWAQSYSRSLNQWQPTDEAYNFVFHWDGHNDFWDGRVTNNPATYPDGITFDIHADGSIWASALMRIHDRIGREKTDRAFLEGLAMTNRITNQQQAAIAVRQAAIDMNYSVQDIMVFTEEFTATGYELPEINFEDNFTITPNPTVTALTVNGLFTDQEKIFISTISGQKVMEQTLTTTENSVDVSSLSPGIYILVFEDRDKQFKFVKD